METEEELLGVKIQQGRQQRMKRIEIQQMGEINRRKTFKRSSNRTKIDESENRRKTFKRGSN